MDKRPSRAALPVRIACRLPVPRLGGSAAAWTLFAVLVLSPEGAGQPARVRPITSEQGWTAQEKRDFYHLSLGSELFPLPWVRALASPSTRRPFLEGLDRFGFLDDPEHAQGLPIGLTAATAKLDPPTTMLGMNCSACHVAEMIHNGYRFRIEGAPNVRMDLVAFNADLARSVAAIAHDPGEFVAFQLRVIGIPEERARLEKLRPGVAKALEEFARWDSSTTADQMHNAVTVALGVLFRPTKASWPLVGDIAGMPRLSQPVTPEFAVPLEPIREEATPPIAALVRANTGAGGPLGVLDPDPLKAQAKQAVLTEQLVNHLVDSVWYLKQAAGLMEKQDRLRNIPGGTPAGPGRVDDFRLARNLIVNEVPLALPATSPTGIPTLWGTNRVRWLGWDGNADSTMQRNIATAIAIGAAFDRQHSAMSIPPGDVYRLEAIGSKVLAPKWSFGRVDPAMAARGAAIYQRLCAECHVDPDGIPPSELLPSWLPDLLYDPAIATDARPTAGVDPRRNVGTDPNRAWNFVADLSNRSAGAELDRGLALLQKALYFQNNIGPFEAQRLRGDRTEQWRPTGKYAGRPLTATWAAAPYLHNDSVPTLYHLLLPAARRPATFRRGGREFDARDVGYIEPPPGEPAFLFDTHLSGNHNTGHEYGVDLPETERRDLLEYLKTK